MALRYSVQPGDTLGLVAARLNPADPTLWTRIWRASRAVSQPDGLPPLDDPNLIYPGQVLLVPLPLPHVSVVGGHLLYIVQPGDSESLIAARLLGSWTRYRDLLPVNAVVTDDNLIQPGLILRLPADALVIPRPRAIQRARRPWHPVRAAPARARAAGPSHIVPVAPPHRGHGLAQRGMHLKPGLHARPTPRVHAQPKAGLRRPQRPPVSPGVPAAGSGHPRRARQPRRVARTRAPHHVSSGVGIPHQLQPGPSGVRPGPRRDGPAAAAAPHAALTPRTSTPLCATPAPALRRPVQSHRAPQHQARSTRPPRPSAPTLRLPGTDYLLPYAFVLAFLGLCAVAVRQLHRPTASGAAGASAGAARGPARPARLRPKRALDALLRRLQHLPTGAFAAVLGRAAARTQRGAVVAHVVATLAACGRAEGLVVDLAATTRRVSEYAERVDLLVEVRRIPGDMLDRVVARLAGELATAVTLADAPTTDADGMTCRVMSVRTAALAAPATVTPHPAPLLVPLGQMAGAVIHVNLARVEALLVAGEARSPHALVATLLASVLVQAPPSSLRLLVATADDELRRALPAAYLDAPAAEADDVAALAGVVTQAHDLVAERFMAGPDGAAGPPVLVLLDRIELLAGVPRLVDRLEAVCRNGRACAVHVIATSCAPTAVAEAGLLAAFSGRLVGPLGPEASRMLWGDEAAAGLAETDVLLRAGPGPLPAGADAPFVPFTLSTAQVAHVLTTVAEAATPPTPHVGAPPTTDAGGAGAGGAARAAEAPGAAQAATGPGAAAPDATGSAHASSSGTADIDHTVQQGQGSTPSAGTDAGAAPRSGAPGRDRGAPTSRRAEKDAPRSAPRIAVQFFGDITLSVDGERVQLYPRESRVLALLGLAAPHAVSVDTIVDTLFADRDTAQGVDAAQKSIGRLRSTLKERGLPADLVTDAITYSSAGYALALAHVDVDLVHFEQLVARSGSAAPDERGALLAAAAALAARGEICAREDGLEAQRVPRRQQVCDALYALMDHYDRVERAPAAALLVAQQLATLDPYNDHYHQAVLSFLEQVGDDKGVEAHYRRLRQDYADAQIPLDPSTRALMAQMRQRRNARLAAASAVPDAAEDLDAAHDDAEEPETDQPATLVS